MVLPNKTRELTSLQSFGCIFLSATHVACSNNSQPGWMVHELFKGHPAGYMERCMAWSVCVRELSIYGKMLLEEKVKV